MKYLRLRLWKTNHDNTLKLCMIIMEQHGLPERKTDGRIRIASEPSLCDWGDENKAYLRGSNKDEHDKSIRYYYGEYSKGNNERVDKDYDRLIREISDELFEGKLPESDETVFVPRDVLVRNASDEPFVKRKLIAIMPSNYQQRYICQWESDPNRFQPFTMAKEIEQDAETLKLFDPRDRIFQWVVTD